MDYRIYTMHCTQNPQMVAAFAGRVCYDSHEKSSGESNTDSMVRGCLKGGHNSIFEHGSIGFLVEMTRTAQNQIVRHRKSVASVQSTRYVQMDKFENMFAIKELDRAENMSPELRAEVIDHLENTRLLYTKLVSTLTPNAKEGRPHANKEIARLILPMITKSRVAITASYRDWLHIIHQRCSKHAEPEIRDIVHGIHKILYAFAPVMFGKEYFENVNMQWGVTPPWKLDYDKQAILKQMRDDIENVEVVLNSVEACIDLGE